MDQTQIAKMLLVTPRKLANHLLHSGDVNFPSLYSSELNVNLRQYLVSIQTMRLRFGLTWEELRVSRLRLGLIRRLQLEELIAEEE
jgi:hypothetical protein